MLTETTGTKRSWPTRPIEIAGSELEVLDTGPSIWLIDRARRRFLLLPSDVPLDPAVFEFSWERYEDVTPTRDGRGIVISRPHRRGHRLYVLLH